MNPLSESLDSRISPAPNMINNNNMSSINSLPNGNREKENHLQEKISCNNNNNNNNTTISPENGNDNDMAFVCNICLEGVKDRDPVVTQCGHLYCWPCLYRWLNTRHGDGTCPICKAGVTQDNVIPIFIRPSVSDPRNRSHTMPGNAGIPSRPQAHRPEPVDPHTQGGLFAQGGNYSAQFGGMTFSAGIGFFPSLFGLQFQSFAPAPAPGATDEEDDEHRAYLSRVLLFLGISVILCLLFF